MSLLIFFPLYLSTSQVYIHVSTCRQWGGIAQKRTEKGWGRGHGGLIKVTMPYAKTKLIVVKL